jgi:hypothetical protein
VKLKITALLNRVLFSHNTKSRGFRVLRGRNIPCTVVLRYDTCQCDTSLLCCDATYPVPSIPDAEAELPLKLVLTYQTTWCHNPEYHNANTTVLQCLLKPANVRVRQFKPVRFLHPSSPGTVLTLKDEAFLFYIRTHCVPRCKHSPLRL